MFTGSAPPSPPRPPKVVPKDQPTPPKASLNDPLTPKTMELLRDNSGDQARWFVQYIWGLRARFRFALRNPMRNPLVTWQQGDRICRSHSLSRSEERAAWILDTLNPESRPPVELSPHPRIPPPRPLPPPDADQPTLTQIDRHPSDRQHVRSLPLPVEADRTGGQSKYSLLPPVTVPHRGNPPAPSHSSVTSSGRRSVSAPLPLSDNALPPRSSLLHPPPAHFSVAHCRLCGQPTYPQVLTFATCACRIVAGCGSICPPTTIYYPGKEGWSVSVTVVITT